MNSILVLLLLECITPVGCVVPFIDGNLDLELESVPFIDGNLDLELESSTTLPLRWDSHT